MQLSARGMKILKTIHLLGATSWLGGAACMLLLNIYSGKVELSGVLYGMNLASHEIDFWIVVNFGVYVCLLTGLLYGLLTPFGFFKFKWITAKWIITCFCFASGWIFLGSWEQEMLAIAQKMRLTQSDHAYLLLKTKHFYLSVLQIGLLITIYVISVFKPGKRGKGKA